MRPGLRSLGSWTVPITAGLVAGFVLWRRRDRGGHWYRFVYRTAYRIGFTPWDRGMPALELAGSRGRFSTGQVIQRYLTACS